MPSYSYRKGCFPDDCPWRWCRGGPALMPQMCNTSYISVLRIRLTQVEKKGQYFEQRTSDECVRMASLGKCRNENELFFFSLFRRCSYYWRRTSVRKLSHIVWVHSFQPLFFCRWVVVWILKFQSPWLPTERSEFFFVACVWHANHSFSRGRGGKRSLRSLRCKSTLGI